MTLEEKYYYILKNKNDEEKYYEFFLELFRIASINIKSHFMKTNLNYATDENDFFSKLHFFLIKKLTEIRKSKKYENSFKYFLNSYNIAVKYYINNNLRWNVTNSNIATALSENKTIDTVSTSIKSDEDIEQKTRICEKFKKILETVNEMQKKIIVLRLKGYSFNEISTILKIGINEVFYEYYSIKKNQKAVNIYKEIQ